MEEQAAVGVRGSGDGRAGARFVGGGANRRVGVDWARHLVLKIRGNHS